jgi:hypothetical protein
MDFIDRIGPVLGIAAFLGLAVMIVLVFLQAREVRRLREWAGRAPERAEEADEATKAAADARAEDPDAPSPGRLAPVTNFFDRRFGAAWDELDRRSPIDPRLLVAGLIAAAIAAGALTSGFGLIGGDDAGSAKRASSGKQTKVKVAVLNATQDETGAGVVGIADRAANKAVDSKSFKTVLTGNAPAGVPDSLVMYATGKDSKDAKDLADQVKSKLGKVDTVKMTPEVQSLAEKAPLALLIGLDDNGL